MDFREPFGFGVEGMGRGASVGGAAVDAVCAVVFSSGVGKDGVVEAGGPAVAFAEGEVEHVCVGATFVWAVEESVDAPNDGVASEQGIVEGFVAGWGSHHVVARLAFTVEVLVIVVGQFGATEVFSIDDQIVFPVVS